ncbi:hypothetical protein PATSB16_40160 [Pandoraea thiooxydans]|nr:hypothetical protein PATSB16_40160 [Pandoraea thiooxydans]
MLLPQAPNQCRHRGTTPGRPMTADGMARRETPVVPRAQKGRPPRKSRAAE